MALLAPNFSILASLFCVWLQNISFGSFLLLGLFLALFLGSI